MPASLTFDPKTWGDRRWRLWNLYWIIDQHGKKIRFVPNEAQINLLDEMWYLNIILKSRQRGFSTFIDILGLDMAVFSRDQTVGIIAHGLREAGIIFKTKVQTPYNSLPAGIREYAAPTSDSKAELSLSNGSSIYVGTSMRSGTVQFLHVSEFGKISRRFPDKAKEIVSGSFNAVHPGQVIMVESTAEGRGGDFYDMCKTSMDRKMAGTRNTLLDFKFHFYPWHTDPNNVLDPTGVPISEHWKAYFDKLLANHKIKLYPAQKAWYVKKAALLGDAMKAEFPSTPQEAFEAAVDGAIYGKEMVRARMDGRIMAVPYMRRYPVNTFWDLGLSKTSGTTAIWCHQYVGLQHRFLKCYESHGQSLDHYVKWLLDTGYAFGVHYVPHDAGQRRLGKDNVKSWKQMLEDLMPGHTVQLVPRVSDITIGINQTQARFDECVIDELGCEDGIKAVENYQYVYDEETKSFNTVPRHDWCSNFADAFRQWGQHEAKTLDHVPTTPAFTVSTEGMGM